MTTMTAITGFLQLLLVITENSLQVESTLVISTDRINTPVKQNIDKQIQLNEKYYLQENVLLLQFDSHHHFTDNTHIYQDSCFENAQYANIEPTLRGGTRLS